MNGTLLFRIERQTIISFTQGFGGDKKSACVPKNIYVFLVMWITGIGRDKTNFSERL